MVGTIAQLWRHPVKSMQGEQVDALALVAGADVPGDRLWAARDEVRGGIRGGRAIPGLLRCQATLTDENGSVPLVHLPDGSVVRADAPDAAARISAAVAQEVTLHPRRPADDLDHYRKGSRLFPSARAELQATFGLADGEALPDFSSIPGEVMGQLREFETPLGTYVDAMPVLVLTDATLRRLAELAPASVIDVRRFRPNVVIATEGDNGGDKGGDGEFPEQAWAGRELRIGGAVLAISGPCPRCVMTTRPFDDVPEDRDVLRTINRHANHNVGVYATVVRGGAVRVGDTAQLVS